ncbi:MAG: winged helix-turn-helix domain-containing protein [Caldimonas sp.]
MLEDGERVAIGTRALDVLAALVERRERVVTKLELLDLAWPGLVVEENNLPVQIGSLRKLLGAKVIATVPGRGYRFVAEVETDADAPRASTTTGATATTASPASIRRSNLPATLPPLIGRDEELMSLAALLESHRLVTVVGAGGIGKSRLAQAVAHGQIERWPDGVWMIELAGASDPALVPNAIAQPLGIAVRDRDTAATALAAGLASRELLLVLDNCEHLLDAIAGVVDRLLHAAPGLRVLATSQEPLRTAAEQQYRINPLPVPLSASVPGADRFGSLLLFVTRVRAANPSFTLDKDTLPLAVELCRRLDGLPLAIEFAAARVPLLGLRTVHDRLDERFRMLTAGARTGLRRHQTLRATLEWSHALLSEAQRLVFRSLGVAAGGFSVALAQSLCMEADLDEWAVIELLGALVEKSLVVADDGEPQRYRLLESARAFALEQLAGAGETHALTQRHGLAMLRFLSQADDGNQDSTLRTDEYAALLLPELDNLRAARAWATGADGDPAVAIGLAAHAGPLIDYSAEFARWLTDELPHFEPGRVDPATTARFWRAMAATNMLGFIALPQLLDAAERAAALYGELQQPRRLFTSLRLVGVWRNRLGDAEGAHTAWDTAAGLIEADWPAELRIMALRVQAFRSQRAEGPAAALPLYKETVRLAEDAGDWRLEFILRVVVCETLWEMRQHDEAAAELAWLLEQGHRGPVSDYELVDAMTVLAWILSERGRVEEAVATARGALPLMRRMPKFALEGCAHLLWRLGRHEAAARTLGAGEALQRSGLGMPGPNEARLGRAAKAGLEAALPAAALATQLTLGESLSHSEVCALLAAALSPQ